MKKNTSSQVIVTGATGFIGQNLIPLLLKEKYDVVALSRCEKKARKFDWFKNVKYFQFDFLEDDIPFKPENNAGLIHLAWQGLPNYSSRFHIDKNLSKSIEIVKSFVLSGVAKVLVTGTCLEYGKKEGLLSAEIQTEPEIAYAIAKDELRKSIFSLQQRYDFISQWARLFYIYGEGQNPNSILSQLDKSIEHKEPVFNMSPGKQIRDYLPVKEACSQIVNLYQIDESIICNICSEIPITIKDLVENHIRKRKANISINLGFYPYNDYEPHAFWGKKFRS